MSINFSPPEPIQLKLCPFCGSKAMVMGGGSRRMHKLPFHISCSSRLCEARTNERPTELEAADLWNSRVDHGRP